MFSSYTKNFFFMVLMIIPSGGAIFGQTSGFSYQGRLTDGGTPANGSYDLQIALFDSAAGSSQIGPIQNLPNVPVSDGMFTVMLDFGAESFTGGSRFLEISMRRSGAAAFITLTPRQQISATPYAVRSLNAANAQQLDGVAASQYVKVGSSNYIQNANSPQASTNFNISGNGTAGGTLSGNTVSAATQYNLGGQPVLGVSAQNVLKLGNTGNVAIGSGTFPTYKLEVQSANKNGLRVGTSTAGGTALSVGGFGTFEVDSDGFQGGRFVVAENGNVGIGSPNPGYRLTVAGGSFLGGDTVVGGTLWASGGFKFPDGSLQSNAVGKVYTTAPGGDLEIAHSGFANEVATLTLPAGVYLVTATIYFENQADDLFQDNTRVLRCYFQNEFIGADRLGTPVNKIFELTFTAHTVFTQMADGQVSLRCGNLEDRGKVIARNRRLTAVRMGDKPN